MRTAKTRGPLSRATYTQVAALRALIEAYLRWERQLGTDQQTLSPKVPTVGRALALPPHVEAEVHRRVRRRIARRPDREAIEARENTLRTRIHHPERSRDERTVVALEGIHRELTRIREHFEAQDRA